MNGLDCPYKLFYISKSIEIGPKYPPQNLLTNQNWELCHVALKMDQSEALKTLSIYKYIDFGGNATAT